MRGQRVERRGRVGRRQLRRGIRQRSPNAAAARRGASRCPSSQRAPRLVGSAGRDRAERGNAQRLARLPRRIVARRARGGSTDTRPGRCRSRRSRVPIAGRSDSSTGAARLDREVRQTARRVDHVRLDDRAGRTGVETARARAALIDAGASGSRSAFVSTSARNSHEPSFGLIRHVFLPIQPRPACSANTRSCTGPLSTHENASKPGPPPRPSIARARAGARGARRGSRRPTRSAR